MNDIGFAIRMNQGADAKKFKFIYELMINEALEKNKNLKLVREIELSNSPEGLEEKMLSDEDEKSVEASAMSGSDTLPEQE